MRLVLSDGSDMDVDDGPFTYDSDTGTATFTSGGEPVVLGSGQAVALFDSDGNVVAEFVAAEHPPQES